MLSLLKYAYMSDKKNITFLLVISFCFLIINLVGNHLSVDWMRKMMWVSAFLMFVFINNWVGVFFNGASGGMHRGIQHLFSCIPESRRKIILAHLILLFLVTGLLLVNVTFFFMVFSYFFPQGGVVLSVINSMKFVLYIVAFAALLGFGYSSTTTLALKKWISFPIGAITFAALIAGYVKLIFIMFGYVWLVANRFIAGEVLGYSLLFQTPLHVSLRNLLLALFFTLILTYANAYISEKFCDVT